MADVEPLQTPQQVLIVAPAAKPAKCSGGMVFLALLGGLLLLGLLGWLIYWLVTRNKNEEPEEPAYGCGSRFGSNSIVYNCYRVNDSQMIPPDYATESQCAANCTAGYRFEVPAGGSVPVCAMGEPCGFRDTDTSSNCSAQGGC